MPKQHKEKFDVGKNLPNMLEEANRKPDIKPRHLPVQKKRFSWKRAIISFFLTLLILVLAAGGWLAWKFEKNCSKVFNDCSLFSLLHTTPLKGEANGRVNILLAGNSVDDPGHQGAELTDSIMLVSLDTRNNTGYMLSIPRDLYVNYTTTNCPYGNSGKINAVYECGKALNFNQAGYASGGMGLLEKIVSQNFGVPIDYYALIDYTAFRDTVNAVGGITVNINSPDGRLYDPSIDYATGGPLVNLPNGQHVLNGEQALDLARARGDAYGSIGFEQSDFQRTADQRLMLTALKNKSSSLGVLANPIKLGNFLDAIGKNVKTDFSGDNLRRLATLVRKIPDSKIKSVGLNNIDGKNTSLLQSTDLDGSTLSPAAGIYDFSQIQAFVQKLNQQ